MIKWPMMLLGEICSFVGGGTPSRTKAEYFDGNIPWATVRYHRQSRWLEIVSASKAPIKP